jgi:hypothetical protein
MKGKDLQKVALSKYRKGDTPKQIDHDLNGGLGLRTIERWCQMIRWSGTVTLSKPPDGPHLARTKEEIQTVKNRLRREKRCQLGKYRWSLIYPKEGCGWVWLWVWVLLLSTHDTRHPTLTPTPFFSIKV